MSAFQTQRQWMTGLSDRERYVFASGVLITLFVAIQVTALWLVDATGSEVAESTGGAGGTAVGGVVLWILAGTGLLLLAIKLSARRFVRAVFSVAIAYTAAWTVVNVGAASVGATAYVFGPILMSAGAALVYWRPTTWTLNAVAVLAATAGVTGLGQLATPQFFVILLVVLAVYDAIAVYVSGHMKTLATAALDWKLPALVVIPLYRGGRPAEGGAIGLGLGDMIIPGIAIVGAATWVGTVPAVGALVGATIGLVVLLGVASGPTPGLPILCSGTFGGYALTAVATGTSLAAVVGLG